MARSSTESEYRALALVTSEIVWIQSLLSELQFILASVPVIWCDNQGASSLASNPVYHARTKHIEIDMHFVRDRVLAKLLDVRYVESINQLADIFTKPLPTPLFSSLSHKLFLRSPTSHLRGVLQNNLTVRVLLN